MEYYEIDGTYWASVRPYKDDQDSYQWRIELGGKRKNCIALTYYTNEPASAHIEGLTYKANCNISSDLVRGAGTREMIAVALSFAKWRFETIETFTLKDMSSIACDDEALDLAALSLAVYGKTWYERHFHAKLDRDPFIRKILKEAKMPFPNFEKQYLRGLDAAMVAEIRSVYDQTTNYQEMFRALKHRACTHLIDWIVDAMSDLINYNPGLEWIIDDVAYVDVSVVRLSEAPDYMRENRRKLFGGRQWPYGRR